jgi:hypothetical protein
MNRRPAAENGSDARSLPTIPADDASVVMSMSHDQRVGELTRSGRSLIAN